MSRRRTLLTVAILCLGIVVTAVTLGMSSQPKEPLAAEHADARQGVIKVLDAPSLVSRTPPSSALREAPTPVRLTAAEQIPSLRVEVTTPEGRPLARGSLLVRWYRIEARGRGTPERKDVLPIRDGHVLVPRLEEALHVKLFARAAPRVVTAGERTHTEPSDLLRKHASHVFTDTEVLDVLRLELRRGVQLRGVFHDAEGVPIAGASVEVGRQAVDEEGNFVSDLAGHSVTTNEEGRFVSRAFRAGTLVAHAAHGPRCARAIAMEGEVRQVTLRLGEIDGPHVRFVDGDGVPSVQKHAWCEHLNGCGDNWDTRAREPRSELLLPLYTTGQTGRVHVLLNSSPRQHMGLEWVVPLKRDGVVARVPETRATRLVVAPPAGTAEGRSARVWGKRSDPAAGVGTPSVDFFALVGAGGVDLDLPPGAYDLRVSPLDTTLSPLALKAALHVPGSATVQLVPRRHVEVTLMGALDTRHLDVFIHAGGKTREALRQEANRFALRNTTTGEQRAWALWKGEDVAPPRDAAELALRLQAGYARFEEAHAALDVGVGRPLRFTLDPRIVERLAVAPSDTASGGGALAARLTVRVSQGQRLVYEGPALPGPALGMEEGLYLTRALPPGSYNVAVLARKSPNSDAPLQFMHTRAWRFTDLRPGDAAKVLVSAVSK